MARTPPSGEGRSRDRGIGSLPASTEIATFLPVMADDPRFTEALSDYMRIYQEEGPRAAFEATGFYSGPATGGIVVREISDYNADLDENYFRRRQEGPTFGDRIRELLGRTTATSLSEILDHEELYNEVPELADMPVSVEDIGLFAAGAYYPDSGEIKMSPSTAIRGPSSVRSVLLHEAAGHGVQDITGLPLGGSPGYEGRLVVDELRRRYPGYGEQQYEYDLANAMERDLRSSEDDLNAWTEKDEQFTQDLSDFVSGARARNFANEAALEAQIQSILASDDPVYPSLPINPDEPGAEVQVYKALDGEALARLVEARQLMQQPALEAIYPGDMLDVSDEEILFVRNILNDLHRRGEY